MTEPILVVDLGTAGTAAAIVAQERIGLLRDPLTGGHRWPSVLNLTPDGLLVGTSADRRRRAEPRHIVDGPRRAVDAQTTLRVGDRELTAVEALAGYLTAVADEAHAVYGEPLRRLVLTVPAGYGVPDARRDTMLAVGAAAGFADVDLLSDAAAAALDPHAPTGTGDRLLVVDLGVSWSVALVDVHPDRPVQVGHRVTPGGRELDAVLVAERRGSARHWLEPLLAAPGDAGLRARQDVSDLVRRLKHGLATEDPVTDHLTPVAPPYTLDRRALADAAAPLVRELSRAVAAVLAEAGAAPADLAGAVLVGGGARLPFAPGAVGDAVGHPPRRSAEPELAVVRGAARWASGAGRRRLPARPSRWRDDVLAFEIPPGARMLRPRPGVPAAVRTPDDLAYRLVTEGAGALRGPLPEPGTPLGPVLALAAERPAAALSDDPPPLRHSLGPAGCWLFHTATQVLIGCTDTGVQTHRVADGTVLAEFQPTVAGPRRLAVGPDGRPVVLTWGPDGVHGWDVENGKLAVRLPAATGAVDVLVDEEGWRIAVRTPGRSPVGRYRRSALTIWDLRTGARLARVGADAWRDPAFTPASTRDGLGATASGPDGQLAAAVDGGQLAVTVRGAEVFRRPGHRAAFTADGRHLLVLVDDGTQRVDVHDV